MSQKEPLFHRQSEASPTGLQTGFPLDISLVRCHFDSCIFKDKFIESGTFLGLRGDWFLFLDVCVAGVAEGSTLGDDPGLFPACGYVEARIPGNSCLLPNSFCRLCCGSSWWDNVRFHSFAGVELTDWSQVL